MASRNKSKFSICTFIYNICFNAQLIRPGDTFSYYFSIIFFPILMLYNVCELLLITLFG